MSKKNGVTQTLDEILDKIDEYEFNGRMFFFRIPEEDAAARLKQMSEDIRGEDSDWVSTLTRECIAASCYAEGIPEITLEQARKLHLASAINPSMSEIGNRALDCCGFRHISDSLRKSHEEALERAAEAGRVANEAAADQLEELHKNAEDVASEAVKGAVEAAGKDPS